MKNYFNRERKRMLFIGVSSGITLGYFITKIIFNLGWLNW